MQNTDSWGITDVMSAIFIIIVHPAQKYCVIETEVCDLAEVKVELKTRISAICLISCESSKLCAAVKSFIAMIGHVVPNHIKCPCVA